MGTWATIFWESVGDWWSSMVWLCKETYLENVSSLLFDFLVFLLVKDKLLCDSYFRWSWELTQSISFINVAEYNTEKGVRPCSKDAHGQPVI